MQILRCSVLTSLFFLVSVATTPAVADTNLVSLADSISKSERSVPNLVAGTEKHIRWFDDTVKKTPFSIVYVHGFSATHREISPVTEVLADTLQANVFYTRLTGHGRDGYAMLEGNVERWLDDVRQAYEIGTAIGEQVIIIGTSTGGTLSTWLSGQGFADKLAANILISPNFGVASSNAWIMQWSLGLWVAKKLNGDYHSFEPQNDYHAKYWTERYPVDAIVPMLDLVDMVYEMDKDHIEVPTMMIYSPQDKVINPDRAVEVMSALSKARTHSIVYTKSIDPAEHVLFGYGSSDSQIKEVVRLIEAFLAP